jgi:hypothetical protein
VLRDCAARATPGAVCRISTCRVANSHVRERRDLNARDLHIDGPDASVFAEV